MIAAMLSDDIISVYCDVVGSKLLSPLQIVHEAFVFSGNSPLQAIVYTATSLNIPSISKCSVLIFILGLIKPDFMIRGTGNVEEALQPSGQRLLLILDEAQAYYKSSHDASYGSPTLKEVCILHWANQEGP